MKKLIIVVLMVMLSVSAYAAVNVKSSSGTVGKTETLKILGPSVTQSGTDIVVDLSTLTGDTEITGALDLTGALDVFGDITGTGVINWDGDFEATGAMLANEAVWIKAVASNPCTGGGGVNWEDQSIFFNAGGDPCFCKGGAAKKMYDGTTNCF